MKSLCFGRWKAEQNFKILFMGKHVKENDMFSFFVDKEKNLAGETDLCRDILKTSSGNRQNIPFPYAKFMLAGYECA